VTDLATCIGRYWIAQATRSPDRPQRAIRVAMLRTKTWRREADLGTHPSRGRWTRPDIRGGDVQQCRDLAATGEHLGLDGVGLVVR
jgi:hypothetical protein